MSRLYEFQGVNDQNYTFDGRSFRLLKGNRLDEDAIDFPELPLRITKPYPRTLALTITNNCNMGCQYCYAGKGDWDKPGITMNEKTAQSAIDLLIDTVRAAGGNLATISFFGGEPLLLFAFIKEMAKYAEEKAGDSVHIRFAIVTNGTLLNTEILKYLESKKFVFTLSLDGNQVMHDKVRIFKNGGGTYAKIVENVCPAIGSMPILVRATISDHNCEIEKVVRHISNLGFKTVACELDYGISKSNFEKYLISNESLFLYYLEEIKNKRYFDYRNITRVLASVLTKRRTKSHCNAGTGYLCCSADGLLYTCHRFIGEEKHVLGCVSEMTPQDLIKKTTCFDCQLKQGPRGRNPVCKTCPFADLCGGSCCHHAYVSTGELYGVTLNECRMKKQIYDQVLRLIVELNGEGLNDFVLYLKERWQQEERV